MMKIINDVRNDLLKRREVGFIIEDKSNPGFTSSLKLVSEKFKSEEDRIALKAVKSKFGRDTFLIESFIYDSKEDKERIEPKKKEKKKDGEAKK